MKNPVIIVDYYAELEAIRRIHPELKDAPVIFTTLQFVPEELAMVERGSAQFFDAAITRADAERMTACIHESLWNWFLDADGKDLSIIDGCSLGLVFAPALEYLFTSVLRYRVGLEKFLASNQDVFCMSNTEETSLAALRHLQAERGFTLHIVEAGRPTGAGERPQLDPPFWRKDELRDLFPRTSWIARIVAALLRWFQRPQCVASKKLVLLSPGGKLENYLSFIKHHAGEQSVAFALPITKPDLWRFLRRSWGNVLFFYFYSGGKREDPRIRPLIDALRQNLRQRITWVDPDALLPLMEQYAFSFFHRAFAHFQAVRQWLAYLHPHLVFLSSDTPLQYLLGIAAKVSNVPVVFCHHCLFMWGQAKVKSGRFQIVDYAIAFGTKDVVDYQWMGVPEERILRAPLPYFARFLSAPKKERVPRYQRALILQHQYAHFAPGAKVEQVLRGFTEPIDVLDGLGIEILGIKVGFVNNCEILQLIGTHFEHRGRRIPLFTGQRSFPDIARQADCIVGSVSTSIVESGLLGIDYYLYAPLSSAECPTPSLCPALTSIMRVAQTPEELRQNIRERRSYHNGHSVSDLVDLSGFFGEEELCSHFSNTLARIVERASPVLSERDDGATGHPDVVRVTHL